MTPDRFSERTAAGVGLAGVVLESFGAHWDIAWHGDIGRDRFLTAPHQLILGGIAVLIVAGILGRRWRPLLLVGACGVLQLATLAVDNWWHNTFGVDVTLWSPPHLLLMALGVIAMTGLLTVRRNPVWVGLLLADTSVLLAEYDFGFPHYRLLWSGLLLAAIAIGGFTVAVNLLDGRWAATSTAAAAVGWRVAAVGLNMAVHRSLPVPPIGLLAGAIVFDLVRTRWSWVATAVVSWLAVVAVQAPWLRLAGKTWWPVALLPQVVVLGAVAAVAAAFVARARAVPPLRWRPLVVSGGAVALLLAPLVGHAAALPLGTQWPVRTAVVTFHGNDVSLEIKGSQSTDWVSLFRQPARRGQPSQWLAGATWHGHGRFTATLRSAPFATSIWFVSGDQVYGNRVVLSPAPREILLYRVSTVGQKPFPGWARPVVSVVLAGVLLLALALAVVTVGRRPG